MTIFKTHGSDASIYIYLRIFHKHTDSNDTKNARACAEFGHWATIPKSNDKKKINVFNRKQTHLFVKNAPLHYYIYIIIIIL